MNRHPDATHVTHSPPPRQRRPLLISGIILAVLLVPAVLLMVAVTLIGTPTGTRRIGRELSLILGQPVTINTIHFRGATVRFEGLAIRNAPPFMGNMLTVKTITIVPTFQLMTGTPSLALLEVSGATLALKQDSSKGWNVAPLIKRLGSRHGSGETLINVLRIQELSLSVNDRVVPLFDVLLRDLATKGSRDASWRVSFTDRKRYPVTITGTARPGPSPVMTLAVTAPEIALSEAARFLTLPPSLTLDRGTAGLHLTASVRGGGMEASGILSFTGIAAHLKERTIPLTGSVNLAGGYRMDRDEVRISRGTITLAGLGAISGAARIRKVKSDREFSADLAADALDLAALQHLLSPAGMKGLTTAGRMTMRNISVAGNARQGMTACRGNVTIEKGEAVWQGRPMVRALAATISMDKRATGWALTGRVDSGAGDPVEVQSLTAIITARLSPRFQPLQVEVAPLSGVVRGIDLSGNIRYVAAATEPFTLNLMTGTVQLVALSPYFKDHGRIEKGAATATLAATASRGLEDIHGSVVATVNDMAATTATGTTVSDAGVNLTAQFRGGKNRPREATGHVAGSGILNAKQVEADVSFTLTPELFRLEQGRVRLDSSKMSFAGLSGQIPPLNRGAVPDVPIVVQLNRLNLAWHDLALEELSGSLDGAWRTTPDGGGFKGIGGLTAGKLSWRSWSAADISARLIGDGTGIGGDLAATGLGGPLALSLKTASLSPETAVSFTGSGRKLSAVQVMTAIGKPLPVAITGGLLDADAMGSFSQSGGVRLTVTTAGSGLAVTRNGTAILNNLGVIAEGDYDSVRLRLQKSRVTIGEKVVVNLSGEIKDIPAATRSGMLTVTVPETSLTDAVNASSGLLPVSLQEIRTEGTFSLNGEVVLKAGKASAGGELHVTKGEVSLPSRQFIAGGIEGTVPISLVFPSAGGATPHRESGFSRETYPRDLALLQQALGVPTLRIAKIRFGSLETGETRFHLKATGTRTELERFETNLYGGQLLGRGGLAWNQGPVYDADLLIHDLSLRSFCTTIPTITGYLSGKVDGIAGLHGERGGLDGALGFFDLWARSSADEELLVSKEFLQKLAGKKLKGFFFRDDRTYDHGALSGHLSKGYVTLSELDIAHTNIFRVRDLSVTVVPTQNRISLEHLISAISTAAKRGKPAKEEGDTSTELPPQTEFKWLE